MAYHASLKSFVGINIVGKRETMGELHTYNQISKGRAPGMGGGKDKEYLEKLSTSEIRDLRNSAMKKIVDGMLSYGSTPEVVKTTIGDYEGDSATTRMYFSFNHLKKTPSEAKK